MPIITLNGGFGRGSLWGTFRIDDSLSSGRSFVSNYHKDYLTIPAEYYLPPPDNVWYDVSNSAYGPKLTYLNVGAITSTNANEFNPCDHTTLRGNAIYRGINGALAPFWRLRDSDWYNSSYYDESFQRLSWLYGKPCSVPNPKVWGHKGTLVSLNCNTVSQDNWYSSWALPLSYASNDLLFSLPPGRVPYETGKWYCKQVSGLKPTNAYTAMRHFYSEWTRPDRLTFHRYSEFEYHDTSSYTPASSISHAKHSLKIPYLVEGNVLETKVTITHIRQASPGMFQLRCIKDTVLNWEGWQYPGRFQGTKSLLKEQFIPTLMILSPGLTTAFAPDLRKANDYCLYASERAKVLYAHKSMESARTAAVRDVQELDSNWIENLVGLKGTLDVVKPLLLGYKAVKSGNLTTARKALAGAYLSYKYVVAPNISDSQNINKDGVRIFDLATRYRFSNERRRGKTSFSDIAVCISKATILYTCTLHLRLKSNYFSQVWSALEKLGLEPTVGQAWDLIPFSFVADWFLPIGDTLRNIDAYNSMMLNRDLICRIEGFKVQWPVDNETLRSLLDNICSVGKPIEYSWYDRRIYQTMGTIDPMATSDSNGLSTSQMAQGAALLTTYK